MQNSTTGKGKGQSWRPIWTQEASSPPTTGLTTQQLSQAPMTPQDAVQRPQGPPPAPVTPLTLPAGSAFGLQPLGTPRVDYDKPADRGSWTVAGGKGGQSSALWENARMVTQSMHLKRDEAAKKRNEEENRVTEKVRRSSVAIKIKNTTQPPTKATTTTTTTTNLFSHTHLLY